MERPIETIAIHGREYLLSAGADDELAERRLVQQAGVEIRSVADMCTLVPKDAIDDFLVDLRSVLLSHHVMRELYDAQPLTAFEWINDAKHESTITLRAMPSAEEEGELAQFCENHLKRV